MLAAASGLWRDYGALGAIQDWRCLKSIWWVSESQQRWHWKNKAIASSWGEQASWDPNKTQRKIIPGLPGRSMKAALLPLPERGVKVRKSTAAGWNMKTKDRKGRIWVPSSPSSTRCKHHLYGIPERRWAFWFNSKLTASASGGTFIPS